MSEPLRTCRDCGIKAYLETDLDQFVPSKHSLYQRDNLCKPCRNNNVVTKRKENLRTQLLEKLGYMKTRCYNENHIRYKFYGGKGITVCQEWLDNSDTFVEWALKNGAKRGLWIDRIDNDRSYSPENCRFVTPEESVRNRTVNTTNYENKTKLCYNCHTEKPITEFHKSKNGSLGRKNICKTCKSELYFTRKREIAQ